MDLMSASVQQLEPLRTSGSNSPVKDDASWREEVEERAQRGTESRNLCVSWCDKLRVREGRDRGTEGMDIESVICCPW